MTSWAATTPSASAGLATVHQGLDSAIGQTCWQIRGVQLPSGTHCNQKRKLMRPSRPLSVKLVDILYMFSCTQKDRLPFGMLQPWCSYSDGLTLKGNLIVKYRFTALFMLKYLGHMTTYVLIKPWNISFMSIQKRICGYRCDLCVAKYWTSRLKGLENKLERYI